MEMQSPTLGALAEALAKAQAMIAPPTKNREVSVRSDKGSYRFKYATLDNIIEGIRKPLTDNGLWFTQRIMAGQNGHHLLLTTLLHSSGEWLAAEQPILTERTGNQAFGSAVTYAKRYALTSLLGIAADEDDDANAADGNSVESSRDRGAPPKPAPAKPLPARPASPPPHDPATTGEVRPHAIGVNPTPDGQGTDWTDFGRRYIAIIKNLTDVDDIDIWGGKNANALANCEKLAPRVYASITGCITKRRDELAQANGAGLPPTIERAIERGITA